MLFVDFLQEKTKIGLIESTDGIDITGRAVVLRGVAYQTENYSNREWRSAGT